MFLRRWRRDIEAEENFHRSIKLAYLQPKAFRVELAEILRTNLETAFMSEGGEWNEYVRTLATLRDSVIPLAEQAAFDPSSLGALEMAITSKLVNVWANAKLDLAFKRVSLRTVQFMEIHLTKFMNENRL